VYFNFHPFFFSLVFLTIFSCNVYAVDKPSKKEEIKDTIVVHGMVLYGKVMNLGPEKLSFRLLYSDGMSHFPYKDIESIHTKYNYHISFKRMDIDGRVVGIKDNKYLHVIDGDKEWTVKITDIDNFVMSVNDDDSFENRVRNKFPYTKGNINLGFEIESGTSTKDSVDILFNLRHKQAEHEIQLYATYEFETTETEDTDKVENKDEFVGILTYKNHFKNNQFYFATLTADYDKPRHIDARYIPTVGYGHRFRFAKSKWLEPSVGIGYAKTNYNDAYTDKKFSVAALNLSGKYQFDNLGYINTFIIDGFIMYYPSLENFSEDWIFRSNLNFTIPLFDFLSVKLVFDNINDSNPNPSVGNNKMTSKLLFGLDF
jgi:hypothetical protein